MSLSRSSESMFLIHPQRGTIKLVFVADVSREYRSDTDSDDKSCYVQAGSKPSAVCQGRTVRPLAACSGATQEGGRGEEGEAGEKRRG